MAHVWGPPRRYHLRSTHLLAFLDLAAPTRNWSLFRGRIRISRLFAWFKDSDPFLQDHFQRQLLDFIKNSGIYRFNRYGVIKRKCEAWLVLVSQTHTFVANLTVDSEIRASRGDTEGKILLFSPVTSLCFGLQAQYRAVHLSMSCQRPIILIVSIVHGIMLLC